MKIILQTLCWIAVLSLWACAASIHLNPTFFGGIASLMGLAFPFSVAGVIAIGIICLILKQKAGLIPLFGLAICFPSLYDYSPINLPANIPDECMKVMTYNTYCLGSWKESKPGTFDIVDYICQQKCDVVCLQEALLRWPSDEESVVNTMKKHGYHYDWIHMSTNSIGIASRYPIVDKQVLCRSGMNGAVAFYLERDKGDTLIVVNAHLESMHLSTTDRNRYHQMIKNPQEADSIQGKKLILSKITKAGQVRALQADTLARFIDKNQGKPMLVMGDFNDTPISYAHYQVCSRLTDIFRDSGNGIGRSFNKDAIIARIDHMFCSEHWKPIRAQVDQSVLYSDHYPIIAYLKPQHIVLQ